MRCLNMKPNATKGVLITFCGLDGCGKTTLIKILTDYLREQGIEPVLTKEPTDFVRKSPIFRNFMDAENHDQYDYRSLSLLAASDRLQHLHGVIAPALNEGKVVISDRYFYSCLANLHARGYESDEWIYEIGSLFTRPDVPIFIHVPLETALARVRERPDERDRYIDMRLQTGLYHEYNKIAVDESAYVLLSDVPLEQTADEMIGLVKKALEEKGLLGGNEYEQRDPELFNDLMQFVATYAKCASFDVQNSLREDLGIDSLSCVTMLLGLEETFGVELDEDDLDPDLINTVEDIIRLGFKKVEQKKGSNDYVGVS